VIEGVESRQLFGREREVAVFERLLDTAREGHGAVLVVDGEPGVGKTALLEYVSDVADEFRVVQTAGIEGEMELEPMNAFERKIVHDAVGEITGVTSFSEGEEPYRRVVIAPDE